MESSNDSNPYRAPESQGGQHSETFDFEVLRSPLFDLEERCFSFAVDSDAFVNSVDVKAEMAPQVVGVVENPTAIFGNLNRENYDDGVAYCGNVINGEMTGYVLLVYVVMDESVERLVVFDWEYRTCEQSGMPSRWQSDFRVKLWPNLK